MLATGAVALTLAACGGNDSETPGGGGAKSGGTLEFATRVPVSTVNPALALGDNLQPIAFDGILKKEPDGSIGPGLATEWGYVGTGNKEFEFTLRDDASFSDGTPVNAEAVKTWLEYVAGASGSSSGFMVLDSVTAKDEWTVNIKLATPNPVVPDILTAAGWGLVSSAEAVKADPEQLSTQTFGAGPYVLDADSTVMGDSYVYVPNKYYYDESRIYWDKIVVRIITTPSTLLQSLQAGEVQGAFANYSTIDAAKKSGFQVFEPAVYQQGFIINDSAGESVEALGDVRVRQAMNYAVDREALNTALYGDSADPSSELASSDGFIDELKDAYPYDPGKAEDLLADAGYADGFEINLVSLDFGGPDFTQGAQAVAGYWEDIGIKVNVVDAANPADYVKGAGDLNNQVVQISTNFASSMWRMYQSNLGDGALYNPRKYSDPTLVSLFEEALTAEDPVPLWEEMSKYITENAFMIPIGTQPTPTFAAKDLDNIEITVDQAFAALPDWRKK